MPSAHPSDLSYHLYLDHLKRCLTGYLDRNVLVPVSRPRGAAKRLAYDFIRRHGFELARRANIDHAALEEGRGWPPQAELTLIGFKRLDNIRLCVEQVLTNGVPGDFIEAGVWRGGASIYMKAILTAHGETERTLWLADSFEGIPPPDAEQYPADAGNELWWDPVLAVSLENVRENFDRYGLLDDRVRFVEGWFRDTLPTLRDEIFALVRLDGDLYESTMDGLVNLYPCLSPGGFIIIDDYGNRAWGCRQAVDDYRFSCGITDAIHEIDWTGICWQKTG
jgi:O-methyltransferase